MATATFYTTAKRHNSTLIPTAGTDYDVVLKNGSDLITPTFYMNLNRVPNWSMMQFEGRYYFITGITSLRHDYWQIDADVDVLATYKTNITRSTQFVVYANTSNTEIIDSRIPIKTTKTVSAVVTPLSDFCDSTGTYLLTVSGAGSDANDTNGPTTYALTRGALNAVMSSVKNYVDNLGSADTESFEAILTIGRQLVGCGHITENILGCTWIPWNVVAMGDVGMEDIYLGVFETTKSGFCVHEPIKTYTTTISIPWQTNDWRRNSPYTQVYLYIPFVGLIHLSSENLINETELSVTVSINRINGNCNFMVSAGDQIIGTYSAATGVGIPVGASGISGETASIGALAHGAAMIAGMAGQSLLAAGAGAVAGVSHIAPNSITAGNLSGGAASGLSLNLRCYTVLHDTVVAPSNLSATVGVPVNRATTLSYTGFVQTQNASVSGSMTDTERARINSLLDGGIYIE